MPLDFPAPDIDVLPRLEKGARFLAKMVQERAAAGFALCKHGFNSEPGQQANRGAVDVWPQHLLHAAAMKGHASNRRYGRGDHTRAQIGGLPDATRREMQHRGKAPPGPAKARI
jgi:hypothetical protein